VFPGFFFPEEGRRGGSGTFFSFLFPGELFAGPSFLFSEEKSLSRVVPQARPRCNDYRGIIPSLIFPDPMPRSSPSFFLFFFPAEGGKLPHLLSPFLLSCCGPTTRISLKSLGDSFVLGFSLSLFFQGLFTIDFSFTGPSLHPLPRSDLDKRDCFPWIKPISFPQAPFSAPPYKDGINPGGGCLVLSSLLFSAWYNRYRDDGGILFCISSLHWLLFPPPTFFPLEVFFPQLRFVPFLLARVFPFRFSQNNPLVSFLVNTTPISLGQGFLFPFSWTVVLPFFRRPFGLLINMRSIGSCSPPGDAVRKLFRLFYFLPSSSWPPSTLPIEKRSLSHGSFHKLAYLGFGLHRGFLSPRFSLWGKSRSRWTGVHWVFAPPRVAPSPFFFLQFAHSVLSFSPNSSAVFPSWAQRLSCSWFLPLKASFPGRRGVSKPLFPLKTVFHLSPFPCHLLCVFLLNFLFPI